MRTKEEAKLKRLVAKANRTLLQVQDVLFYVDKAIEEGKETFNISGNVSSLAPETLAAVKEKFPFVKLKFDTYLDKELRTSFIVEFED